MEKSSYNLEERTAKFGENTIKFCRQLKQSSINQILINQLVRSATSVGANYMEAIGGSSKKDFRNKIFISKKEIQETKHWLRMIQSANDIEPVIFKELNQEAQELTLIFGKILSTLNNRMNSGIK